LSQVRPMATSWSDVARKVADAAVARKGTIGNTVGAVAPLGLAAALVPLRQSFVGTAAALALVAVVAAIAILGSRFAGFVASVSSALSFDFFLTRPYERFAISHRSDLETAISLFVVGLIVTELAARVRHHRRVAAEESDYLVLIHDLGEMVAQGAQVADVIERASNELIHLLHLRRCSYLPGVPDPKRTTVQSHGEVVLGSVRWGIATMGLPGRELDLPVHHGGRKLGRFVIVPTPGWPVSHERMIVAVAIAGQVGAALTTRIRIA
jgi:K+-sensing histidine kinase KdpD